MRLIPPRWGLPRSRKHAVIAAVAMMPALVACNGAGAPVVLPPRSPAATSAASTTPRVSLPQQQVTAAFNGYNDALREAERSRNASEAASLLRPFLSASQIVGTVQTMTSVWASGEVFIGQDVVHILGVTVRGATAFVHDCEDTSSAGLENVATGQVVPGSTGIPHLNLVTRLGLVGGHWLVQSQVIEDVPCAA